MSGFSGGDNLDRDKEIEYLENTIKELEKTVEELSKPRRKWRFGEDIGPRLLFKRELIQGHLSTRQQFSLPAVAAIGGITVPAIIYISLNFGNDVTTFNSPALTNVPKINVVQKNKPANTLFIFFIIISPYF